MISRLQEAGRLLRAIVPTPCLPALHCWLVLSFSSAGTEDLVWASFKEELVSKIKKKAFCFIEFCIFKTNRVIYQGPE